MTLMTPEKHRTTRLYIAVRVKAALEAAGYTVIEAAPHVGCSSVSLYRKVRGERALKIDELDRVVKLTGRDFSFFFPRNPQ